jgi:hypothetical protein
MEFPVGILEHWNTGMMDSWISFTLIEVGRASACGGLEDGGQEYVALCLRSFVPQDKLSDPQSRETSET